MGHQLERLAGLHARVPGHHILSFYTSMYELQSVVLDLLLVLYTTIGASLRFLMCPPFLCRCNIVVMMSGAAGQPGLFTRFVPCTATFNGLGLSQAFYTFLHAFHLN